MITLITGTPGAGKTLYAISKLLRQLVGTTVKKTEANGTTVDIPRRILTNINGLLIDHELIGPDAGGGLADWHTWAKPGDVICYDEVQKSWPPRANGSKVPDYIQALETHRHMGVDFIILTQNPLLIDRNVTALIGRHLHVRRFGGLGAAIVYEWDHCSRSLLFSKSLNKAPFRYDKSVFKLYKSAELHTKPKTSIPTLAIVVVLALVGAAFAIPYASERVLSKGQSKPAFAASAPAAGHTKPAVIPSLSPVPIVPHAPAVMVDAVGRYVHPAITYSLAEIRLVGMMMIGHQQTYFFRSPDGLKLESNQLEKVGYKFSKADGCSVYVENNTEARHYLCEKRDDDNLPASSMTASPSDSVSDGVTSM